MRWGINVLTDTDVLPCDYKRLILSLIKHAMTECGGGMTEKYYSSPRPKPYCFSVFLPGAKFSGQNVKMTSMRINIKFSVEEYPVAWELSNAFNAIKGKKWTTGGVGFTVERISMEKDTNVSSRAAVFKLIAPLVLREHDKKTNSDCYYTVEDKEFEEKLRIKIADQLDAFGKNPADAYTLKILNCKDAKKTVAKHYGKCFGATVGVLALEGDTELLNWLYDLGMGSLRSSGFGMVELLAQGGEE